MKTVWIFFLLIGISANGFAQTTYDSLVLNNLHALFSPSGDLFHQFPIYQSGLTGKIVQSGIIPGKETIIDIQKLPAGMYFLKTGEEKIQTLKFVKAKN